MGGIFAKGGFCGVKPVTRKVVGTMEKHHFFLRPICQEKVGGFPRHKFFFPKKKKNTFSQISQKDGIWRIYFENFLFPKKCFNLKKMGYFWGSLKDNSLFPNFSNLRNFDCFLLIGGFSKKKVWLTQNRGCSSTPGKGGWCLKIVSGVENLNPKEPPNPWGIWPPREILFSHLNFFQGGEQPGGFGFFLGAAYFNLGAPPPTDNVFLTFFSFKGGAYLNVKFLLIFFYFVPNRVFWRDCFPFLTVSTISFSIKNF